MVLKKGKIIVKQNKIEELKIFSQQIELKFKERKEIYHYIKESEDSYND